MTVDRGKARRGGLRLVERPEPFEDARSDEETGQSIVPVSAWVALFFGTASVFVNMYTTQSILPVIGQAFRLTAATAGLTVSATVFAVAFGSFAAGPLSDRVGRKPVMVGASLLLVVPTLLVGLAPSFPVLVVLRALQGLLMPGLTSVAIVYVYETFPPRQRGAAMGVYVSGQVLGGLVARTGSATLTGLFDWRVALLSFTVPTVLGALALWRFLPHAPQTVSRRDLRWSDIRMHLRNGRLLATCATGGGLFFAFVGIFTYLPYVLIAPPFRLPAGLLGLVYLAWGAGVVSPFSGALAGRIGKHRALAGSLTLACIGIVVMLSSSLPFIVVGLVLMTMGMFSAIPALNLLVGEVSGPTAKGAASALYLSCYYTGGGLGGLLPGLVWEHLAWPGVVGLCLVVTLGTLGVNIGAARHGRASRGVLGGLTGEVSVVGQWHEPCAFVISGRESAIKCGEKEG